MLYTKYFSIEKETPMKLFSKVFVDVNDDGKNDISAKISIFPSIEKPLSLAINFALTINRLVDFPNNDAEFEAYTKLLFPGFLSPSQKGDTVLFGYSSMNGEEVPSECVVTYKYTPNVLSTKTPDHKFKINPGSSVGNSKLTLILSYVNVEDEIIKSQFTTSVAYNKAVKSEIHIYGTGILGGSTFTFEKTNSDKSNVDLYCTFFNNKTAINGYVLKMPQKVTFDVDFGKSGHIEFNTHGESVKDIGITDSSGTNKVYFSDLPSKARLEWNRHLLFYGKATLYFYSEGSGVSLNAHLEFINGTFDFGVSSHENLDCYAYLDTHEGYFSLNRTNVNVSLFLSAEIANGTFDLSFDLERFSEKPFEIFYDKLINEEIEISLATKFLSLSNFSFLINTTSINMGVKADKIVKENYGNFTIILLYEKVGKNFTFNLTIFSDTNISLYGLSFGFNKQWSNKTNLFLEGNKYHHIEFTFVGYDFDYYVAEDMSWGYFFFRGGMSYDTIQEFVVNNGTISGFKGKIYAGSGDDGLNISWYTDSSKGYNLTKLNITGFVLGLEDFYFYLGEYIVFSISKLEGSIDIHEACNESGRISLALVGTQSLLDINILVNLTNTSGFNLTLNLDDINVDISDSTITMDIEWFDSNLSLIQLYSLSDVAVSIKDFDLIVTQANNSTQKILVIENFTGCFVGYAGFDVSLEFPINSARRENSSFLDLSENTFAINITDADIFLHIDDVYFTGNDLGFIGLSANVTDTIKISICNISFENNSFSEKYYITWINTTLNIDANNGVLNLNLLEIENFDVILNLIFGSLLGDIIIPNDQLIVENISIVGNSDFKLSLGIWNYFPLPTLIGIRFDDEPGTHMTLEKLSIIFPGFYLQNYTDSPVTIVIDDLHLNKGVFDLLVSFLPLLDFELINGSAIINLNFGIEISGFFKAYLSIDEPIDYFHAYIPISVMDFLILDTHNSTVSADLYVLYTSEFRNLSIETIEKMLNTSISVPDLGIRGFRINNVTLEANYFSVNVSSLKYEGYIHLEGNGSIDILRNGMWEELVGNKWFYVTISEGFIQIKIDVEIKDFLLEINEPVNGDEIFLTANITCLSPNTIINIMWGGERENITYLKFETIGSGSIFIKNFLLKLNDKINISWSELILEGSPTTYNVSINYEEEVVWIDGSLGLHFVCSDLFVKVDSSVLAKILPVLVNCTVEVPLIDVSLGAEGSKLVIPIFAMPFSINPDGGELGIGDTLKLTAKGHYYLESVCWQTLNPEIVNISNEIGPETTVTGLRRGTATIVAYCGMRRAQITINVRDDFFITPGSAEITVGRGGRQLTPHNYKDPITWESSNESMKTSRISSFD